MLAATLVTFREGLEAFLVVAITLAYLTKLGEVGARKYIWTGTGLAVVASALIAVAFRLAAFEFEGASEQAFEAVVALVAVGVLTWMIFWMQRQARAMRGELESRTRELVLQGSAMGLGVLAFVAVIREGLETALFLSALGGTANGAELAAGAVLGLIVSGIVVAAIFLTSIRLNLRTFFTVTGVMLIFIAAGLLGQAVHELQELGVLPFLAQAAWSTKAALDEKASLVGSLLRAFIGYDDTPSVLHALAYAAYLATALYLFLRRAGSGGASR